MKTVYEVLESASENEDASAWREDEYGIVMYVQGFEIRIEPLLFGGAYLAVYEIGDWGDTDLVGEKLPITLGTPARNGHKV